MYHTVSVFLLVSCGSRTAGHTPVARKCVHRPIELDTRVCVYIRLVCVVCTARRSQPDPNARLGPTVTSRNEMDGLSLFLLVLFHHVIVDGLQPVHEDHDVYKCG